MSAVQSADLVGLLARACERLLAEVFMALDTIGYGDLTSTQAFVLRTLAGGGSTVTALAAVAGTTGPAMSKATAGLEQRGLMRRVDNPDDARSRHLQLTADGRRVVRAIAAAESTALARWERQVGSKDLAAVRRALQLFVDDRPVERTAAPRRLRFE